MPRRRFSTGGDEESWSHSLQRVRASLFSFSLTSTSGRRKPPPSMNNALPELSSFSLFASFSISHSLYIKLAVFPHASFFFSLPLSASPIAPSQIGSGIGRMILKEEMKARSGSYDNDPWGSARNSRSGSKETLNTTGYGTPAYNNTVNGCKDPPCPYASASLSLLRSVSASSRMPAPLTVLMCSHVFVLY